MKKSPKFLQLFPYIDRVYGSFSIGDFDVAAIKLIKTAPFQRLSGVYQHGPDFIQDPSLDVTRAEHSVGVYLLLRHLGASLNERIAGLLHDISHTAFSHTADFFDDNHSDHQYAEAYMDKFIKTSAIAKILEEFNIAHEEILNYAKHSLLERPIPDLCADRVDYLYRDAIMKNLISRREVRKNLDSLTVINKKIVFKNRASAEFFAETFIVANEKIFATPRTIFNHQILADAIMLGLEKGFLTHEDLFTIDSQVWEKLKKADDSVIGSKLNLISSPLKLDVSEAAGKNKRNIKSKVRHVDPEFLENGRLVRLSTVNPKYSEAIKKAIAWQKRGFFVKITDSNVNPTFTPAP